MICQPINMQGWTLLELVTTLAITAALAGLALFGTSQWITEVELHSDRNQFATLINLSRAAAVDLNHPVILCPGDPISGCGPRNTWHKGIMAFADMNRDRKFDPDDTLLAVIPGFTSRIEWRSFRNRSHLRFRATGVTDWQNGHFKFCPLQPARKVGGLQLVLNAVGRLYFSRDTDGDGVHEDVQGRPLLCL
jgi:Tfp pilus assembly protein FimT